MSRNLTHQMASGSSTVPLSFRGLNPHLAAGEWSQGTRRSRSISTRSAHRRIYAVASAPRPAPVTVHQGAGRAVVDLATISHPVTEDIRILNENLRNVVGQRHPMLMAAADQIFGAGGKKIRPLLVLLVAYATQAIKSSRQAIIFRFESLSMFFDGGSLVNWAAHSPPPPHFLNVDGAGPSSDVEQGPRAPLVSRGRPSFVANWARGQS